MVTEYLTSNDIKNIIKGAELIKGGALVAFPTETVYGLGANGLDEKAVKSIFKAKGRPSDNPLILHISTMEDAEKIANLNENSLALAKKFWPGPLTMVLNKKDIVPFVVTGGLSTVAIRMPASETALKLINFSGVPIAAPSANTSGKPSPTRAKDVLFDLNGKIEMIIDGGNCDIGIESTVIDLTGETPLILRPGAITLQMIKSVLPDAEIEKGLFDSFDSNKAPKCPGMKYKHYSPEAQVIVFEQSGVNKIPSYIEKYKNKNIILYCNNYAEIDYKNKKTWGENAQDMAKNLFADLRSFDSIGYEVILCQAPELSELGQSVRNRLYKSAGYNIVK